jgi:hypothetical protein
LAMELGKDLGLLPDGLLTGCHVIFLGPWVYPLDE